MRSFTILTIVAAFALSTAANAAPNCVKGKLCGNSCIKQSDVCHKPTAAAAAAPAASPAPTAAKPAPAASAAPATPAKSGKCKNAKGKFAKCGSAGAVPVQ